MRICIICTDQEETSESAVEYYVCHSCERDYYPLNGQSNPEPSADLMASSVIRGEAVRA